MNKNAMKYYVNALAGLTKKEADNFFKDIADIFIDHFNEKVVQRLHEHLRNDDYLMLVSGAYVPLLRQATKQYPFHQVVGTKRSEERRVGKEESSQRATERRETRMMNTDSATAVR